MILEMLKKAERVDFRFGGVRSGSFCDHVFFRHPNQEETGAIAGGKQNGLLRPSEVTRPSSEKKERPSKEAALLQINTKIRSKAAQEAQLSTNSLPLFIDAQVEEKIITEVINGLDNPDKDVRQII
jgi:hypothetical protein